MYYIIILIIWIAEIFIIPYCNDSISILIASAPFFITLPIILSSFSYIPSIFLSFLIVVGVILAILIVYQLMNELI
ncbi:MAG: hypothetical protein ACTSRP_00145 [Candidatus Helarchaeota archaeon]